MYEFSLHTRQANYTHYTFTSIFIDVCACINSLILVPLICGCITCVCACTYVCMYVCVHVAMVYVCVHIGWYGESVNIGNMTTMYLC